MNAPLFVVPQVPSVVDPAAPPGVAETNHLLRQLVDAQRETNALLKAQLAAADQTAKWRAFLARWAEEFPGIGGACKQTLPVLEQTFLTIVRELTDRLKEAGDDLADEFVLGEFLDRFGIRVGQLGTIINQLGPLAEAVPPPPAEGP
ncbi:MAG: hypothetical protein K2X87_08900 [Gemmataceae bacterium]|nr:hypothetical protein [Gemmataceae bacterium]